MYVLGAVPPAAVATSTRLEEFLIRPDESNWASVGNVPLFAAA